MSTDARLRFDMDIEEFRVVCDAGLVDFSTAHLVSLSPFDVPSPGLDPDGAAYADIVMRHWESLSGRGSYDPRVDEQFDLDREAFLARPYPYNTGDPLEIGRYLGAIAGLLRRLDITPPACVCEMGAGWGLMSMTLATAGFDVTAVDLNPDSVQLLKERARVQGVPLNVVQAGFLDYEPAQPFDAIVFFEAFHHCARPLELLDRCVSWLNEGGRVIFVAETIYDWFHQPWGVRLDGHAAFATRRLGWLELGFETNYFYRQLLRRGLAVRADRDPSLGPYGTYLIASRWRGGIAIGGTLLPTDEARTWRGESLGAAGRIATSHSIMTLPDGPATTATLAVVNLSNAQRRLEVGSDDREGVRWVLASGERRTLPVSLPPGQRRLFVAADEGENDNVGVCVESLTL